jgi:hypothetical protein
MRFIERRAFAHSPRRCRDIGRLRVVPVSMRALLLRARVAHVVLTGPATRPIRARAAARRKALRKRRPRRDRVVMRRALLPAHARRALEWSG